MKYHSLVNIVVGNVTDDDNIKRERREKRKNE